MSRRRVRLDWVASAVRDTVDPATLGDLLVDHFSIPALEETGGPIGQPASEIESGKQLLVGGEVLISRLNPRKARVLRVVTDSQRPMLCSGEFIVLRPREIESRFLEYVLLAESTRQFLDGAVQSVTRSHQRVRPDLLAKMWIDLPSPAEQRATADFLDRETARIDALIVKKRRMIVLLEERKRVELADLALGANLPGDRSDTQGLGALPSSWKVARIRQVVPRVGVGVVVNPSSYFADGGVPFLHGSNVQEGWIDLSNVKRMSRADSETLWRSKLETGDVVVVRAGFPGRAAAVTADLAGANCASVLILKRSRVLLPEYLVMCLNSPVCRGQVQAAQYGAAQEQINVSDIVDFVLPLPPRADQAAAVDEAATRRQLLDRTTVALRAQVNLLVERRQALITAAVTGELDIDGAAA